VSRLRLTLRLPVCSTHFASAQPAVRLRGHAEPTASSSARPRTASHECRKNKNRIFKLKEGHSRVPMFTHLPHRLYNSSSTHVCLLSDVTLIFALSYLATYMHVFSNLMCFPSTIFPVVSAFPYFFIRYSLSSSYSWLRRLHPPIRAGHFHTRPVCRQLHVQSFLWNGLVTSTVFYTGVLSLVHCVVHLCGVISALCCTPVWCHYCTVQISSQKLPM
jgi:hypothetical protein